MIFGGRLAEYKYYNMDDVIKNALDYANVFYISIERGIQFKLWLM